MRRPGSGPSGPSTHRKPPRAHGRSHSPPALRLSRRGPQSRAARSPRNRRGRPRVSADEWSRSSSQSADTSRGGSARTAASSASPAVTRPRPAGRLSCRRCSLGGSSSPSALFVQPAKTARRTLWPFSSSLRQQTSVLQTMPDETRFHWHYANRHSSRCGCPTRLAAGATCRCTGRRLAGCTDPSARRRRSGWPSPPAGRETLAATG